RAEDPGSLMSSDQRGFAARVRDTLRELFHSEAELVDSIADRVDATVQRWAEAAGMRRFAVEHGGDRLVLVGEPVEVTATLGPIRRTVADEVVFFPQSLGDESDRDVAQELGRAPHDRDGVASIVTRFSEVGLVHVEARAVGRSGLTFDEP